jgi:hypothetical protein
MRTAAAAAAVLVVALLTGCQPNDNTSADTDDVAPGTAVTGAADPGGPVPTARQADELRSELRQIDPSLNSAESVTRARFVCRELTAGTAERDLVAEVQTGFGDTPSALDPGQAERVLAVIRDSEWCRG